ncbi:MAG TPA: hypothetical protein PLY73_11300 [Candidatus Ozemobacteraceae bacterium]|nr:hypothetical protein [Candidatus Ozemobacteraceae bacterium]
MFSREYLLKNCSLLNLILLIAVIVLACHIVPPLLHVQSRIAPPRGAKPATEPYKHSATDSNPVPVDFRIITEQNLFHPSRKAVEETGNGQPLPVPDIVLYGTLIMNNLTAAYVQDRKSTSSTPGRENRQRLLKKGDMISGFVLKEVGEDRIVLARGDERMVVFLNEKKNRKTGEASLQPADSRRAAAMVSPLPVTPPSEPLERPKRPTLMPNPAKPPKP